MFYAAASFYALNPRCFFVLLFFSFFFYFLAVVFFTVICNMFFVLLYILAYCPCITLLLLFIALRVFYASRCFFFRRVRAVFIMFLFMSVSGVSTTLTVLFVSRASSVFHLLCLMMSLVSFKYMGRMFDFLRQLSFG